MSITPQPPADFSPDIQDSHFTPSQTGYTGQGSFRFWCQTVLPLVYDDSLSYYELLNKVVHYLNNVISDVASVENNVVGLYNSFNELQDNTNNNIELLLGAYNELQSYVNSYFDNLDVQEEINNKLDTLAEDGTLTSLIAPLAPDVITEWLNEHITPTTPIVDDTLTISGAAADAKVTGDIKRGLNITEEYVGIVPFSENDGFILGNGAISQPTSSNEKYTSEIFVSTGDTLEIYHEITPATSSMWLAYCTYDINGVFLERIILVNNVIQGTYIGNITVDNGVKSIRFTYRAYNGGVLLVTKPDADLYDIIDEKISNYQIPGSQIINESITLNKLGSDIVNISNNLFNQTWEHANYNSNGEYILLTSSNVRHVATPPTLDVVGGSTYTISFGNHNYNDQSTFYIHQFDSNGTRLKYTTFNYSLHKYTITLENDTVFVGFMIYAFGSTLPSSFEDIIPEWTQFELGDVATEYTSNKIISYKLMDYPHIYEKLEGKIGDQISNFVSYNQLSTTINTIAHRGDDVLAPQCTAPAYILARKNGNNIAENDLWLSEDGQLVMWHDTSLARLGNMVDINGYLMYTDQTRYYWVNPDNNAVYTWNGTGYVASSMSLSSLTRCVGSNYGVNSEYGTIGLDLDILKRIDFGIYKGTQFAGTQILTFAEWVLLCKQLGMEIYIDKKLTYTSELLTNAANIVKNYGMSDHSSWLGIGDISDINLLRTIIPNARVGILTYPTPENVVTYAPVNTGRGFFFDGDAKNGMTAQAIQTGLSAGFEVEVWFVDTLSYTEEQILETIRTAVSYGVTGITLDHYKVEDAFTALLEQY